MGEKVEPLQPPGPEGGDAVGTVALLAGEWAFRDGDPQVQPGPQWARIPIITAEAF